MNEHIFNLINALFDGAVVGLITAGIWMVRTMTRLESDVSWIKQGIIFNGRASGMQMHSPHTPEFDRLFEAYWHGTLAKEEVPDFMHRLQVAVTDASYDKAHKKLAIDTLTALSTEYKIPINETP